MKAKYKEGDCVTVKPLNQLKEEFEYERGVGYIDPVTNIVFVTGMERTCGLTFRIKKIERVGKFKPVTLYYLGVKSQFARDYNYAYVESFFQN